ncbi:MAG: PadR family transcriptional regulator [Anaerolineales bacterium]|nr:PadR family transcriptional regulator [Anaerolineales bacterium]
MPLAHAILGFLEYQPMTGYDLKKFFDQSVAHFWSAAQSHIYKALETLEKDGFVESQIIQGEGKPNRKQYQITEEGRSELHRWVVTPLPLAATREAWLIQIFFSHASSNEEIIELLKARANNIREMLEAFHTQIPASVEENSAREGMTRMSQLWKLTADYGADYYKSELAWLDKTIKKINKLPPLK